MPLSDVNPFDLDRALTALDELDELVDDARSQMFSALDAATTKQRHPETSIWSNDVEMNRAYETGRIHAYRHALELLEHDEHQDQDQDDE